MIIQKDEKKLMVSPEVWNDDVRIYSDATEILSPEVVFRCNGLVSGAAHCNKLMNAVYFCRNKGIVVGLVISDKTAI